MKKLATLLEGLFESQESIQGKSLLDLQQQWSEIVKKELAKDSYPKDLPAQGVLLVEVLHSSAMQMLQLQKHSLLERLQNDFKQLAITRIRFKQVPHLSACFQEKSEQKKETPLVLEKHMQTLPKPKKNKEQQTYQQFLKDLLK